MILFILLVSHIIGIINVIGVSFRNELRRIRIIHMMGQIVVVVVSDGFMDVIAKETYNYGCYCKRDL